MRTHGLRRRVSALATVTGLGFALPFAVGATPASAQPVFEITKTHEGNFARGGQGVYTINVTNSGDEGHLGAVFVEDTLPTGLTFQSVTIDNSDPLDPYQCTTSATGFSCNAEELTPGETAKFTVTVNVADNAPCSVTNTATVRTSLDTSGISTSASDPTTITGGDCDGGNGGNGGSILPISLNGLIPMFNNITTNNNINSPGASNNSHQVFGVNAP